ncbi:MAG TPA: hypothetical protein VHK70_04145 [Burkholderiaceae bacterium]|jgi:hypothetical protein|nr:hypothetical protein [Burkholderiaceae bacterium]
MRDALHEIAALGKLMVLSPHLDNAVFACGELIAATPDTVVVTLFAGAPAAGYALTEWDAAAGFSCAREAIVRRIRHAPACRNQAQGSTVLCESIARIGNSRKAWPRGSLLAGTLPAPSPAAETP